MLLVQLTAVGPSCLPCGLGLRLRHPTVRSPLPATYLAPRYLSRDTKFHPFADGRLESHLSSNCIAASSSLLISREKMPQSPKSHFLCEQSEKLAGCWALSASPCTLSEAAVGVPAFPPPLPSSSSPAALSRPLCRTHRTPFQNTLPPPLDQVPATHSLLPPRIFMLLQSKPWMTSNPYQTRTEIMP